MSTSECPFTLSASANANNPNHFGAATQFWSISWNIVADASVRRRAEVVLTLVRSVNVPLAESRKAGNGHFLLVLH